MLNQNFLGPVSASWISSRPKHIMAPTSESALHTRRHGSASPQFSVPAGAASDSPGASPAGASSSGREGGHPPFEPFSLAVSCASSFAGSPFPSVAGSAGAGAGASAISGAGGSGSSASSFVRSSPTGAPDAALRCSGCSARGGADSARGPAGRGGSPRGGGARLSGAARLSGGGGA